MINDCIFCKISEGKIPCFKVYEDEKIISFLDISPYCVGHLLVIPKEHYKWVWDIPSEDYSYLMSKTKYFAEVLKKTFDTEWVEEVIAGLGVSHAHIHLLPRKFEDGLGDIPTKPLNPKLTEDEMKEILNKIKNNLF